MRIARKRPPGPASGESPYLGLRRQFLELDAAAVAEPLRGVALEFGMASGSATVVCVADGTTSMYTSGGGGYLGMGRHEAVQQANAVFRRAVASRLELLTPVTDVPVPGPGE